MVDSKEGDKTLEMRVAELEDRLKGMEVTEEEMRAFNKVASMMGGGVAQQGVADSGAVSLTPVPSNCVINQCSIVSQCVRPCIIRQCTIINQCSIQQCTIVQQCIQQCINECGGGLPGGGGFGGGGFGNLGG